MKNFEEGANTIIRKILSSNSDDCLFLKRFHRLIARTRLTKRAGFFADHYSKEMFRADFPIKSTGPHEYLWASVTRFVKICGETRKSAGDELI